MRIIINADDFGYDADTVEATIECFATGALTSASIMPNMPATETAITFALANPQFSYGAHLTFCCDTVEAPVGPVEDVSSLLRPDGRFLSSQKVRMMALLRQIPLAQIAAEAGAQIDFLTARGIKLSHVDSHGHIHKFSPFRQALAYTLKEKGIKNIRNVQDIYLSKPLKSPTYWLGHYWRKAVMDSFNTTDHFFMCTGANDREKPNELLARLSGCSVEVGVHPGHGDPWRLAEYHFAQIFAQNALADGHKLIGWRQL